MTRPLSDIEKAALEAMISQGHDSTTAITPQSRQRWLAQAVQTSAGEKCPCMTCPSIELQVATSVDHDPQRTRVVLSAEIPGAMLHLFIDRDQLSYLELAPIDLDGHVASFPAVEAMSFH